MGRRIAFYEIKNEQSLKETFVENYFDFKQWTLCQNKNSIKEYNEQIISNEIENFLKSNDVIDIEKTKQDLLDELLVEFLLTYCEHGNGSSLIKLIGPLISTYRYETSFKIIARQKNKTLFDIWKILKVGRSLKNDNDFTIIDGDVIGFWNKKEQDYIRDELNKIEYKNDIGIKCIKQVLAEIGKNKKDLIILVEK